MGKRSQASFDYLVIVGIAMVLIIPTFYLFYTHSREASTQIASSRMDMVGSELLKQSKTIYYTGKNAKTTVEFELPDNLVNFTVENNSVATEMVMTTSISGVNQSLVFFTDIPIFLGNCTELFPFNTTTFYNPGKKRVVVESCGSNVTLRLVK
jgi:hypothetical protein